MAWVPPPVTARHRLRLFQTDTTKGADVKLDLVGRELADLGLESFCERYRIPMTFVESLEPPDQFKGLRRFRRML